MKLTDGAGRVQGCLLVPLRVLSHFCPRPPASAPPECWRSRGPPHPRSAALLFFPRVALFFNHFPRTSYLLSCFCLLIVLLFVNSVLTSTLFNSNLTCLNQSKLIFIFIKEKKAKLNLKKQNNNNKNKNSELFLSQLSVPASHSRPNIW